MRSFTFAVIFMFVIAILLRVDFFFKIVYLFVALYLLSRVWMRRFNNRHQAYRNFVDRAFTGELVGVELAVENTDWLPVLGLEIREDLPIELISSGRVREAFALGPKEKRKLSYTMRCRKRGLYSVGPLRLRALDLLGIAQQNELQLPARRLTVYPKVVPLEHLGLPTHSPLAVLPSSSPLFEDPCRVTGVRNYQHGDSPRRIHWTATARSGQLLVKQYKPAIARETLICLDLDERSYDLRLRYAYSELAISAAASIANHIIAKEGLAAGLAMRAYNPLINETSLFSLPPRTGQAYLLTLLEALALVRLTPDALFVEMLRQQRGVLPWGATMVVITGNKSPALLETLLYLRTSGMAVALILVNPGLVSTQLDDPVGVPVYKIWYEEDLERGL